MELVGQQGQVFAHLSAPNAALYLEILVAFARAKERFIVHLRRGGRGGAGQTAPARYAANSKKATAGPPACNPAATPST
jgi:hypothetical protein